MKTLIFDLDGTLVDATRVIVAGFNHALTRQGLPPWQESRVLAMMGRPLAEMFAGIAGEHDLDCGLLVETYVEYSRAHAAQGIVLLPGASELLCQCREENYQLGVYTSRTTASARRILRLLKVDQLLTEIVGIDQVTYPKPHPEGVELLLGRFQVRASQSWMLGDTPDDVKAARAAGVRALAVSTGYFSSRDLEIAGAERVFRNLESVQSYLAPHPGPGAKGEQESS